MALSPESREAVSLRYRRAEQELREIGGRMASFGTVRPSAVIDAAIVKARQDRYWSSSGECRDATVEASRVFCRSIGDLDIERAKAVEIERLQERVPALKAEIDSLVSAGARNDQDQQAGLLSRLTGYGVAGVQTSIVTIFAALVEFGSAFGLFLALLPVRGAARSVAPPQAELGQIEIVPVAPLGMNQPTRFARAPNGQLMIE